MKYLITLSVDLRDGQDPQEAAEMIAGRAWTLPSVALHSDAVEVHSVEEQEAIDPGALALRERCMAVLAQPTMLSGYLQRGNGVAAHQLHEWER